MNKNITGEITMSFRRRIISLAITSFAVLAISACSDDKGTSVQDSIVTTGGPVSNYDLGDSVIPFPNDLLFQGTTTGTLNIPVDDPADLSDPQVALNGVDGFSTVAPMSTGFSTALSADSITGTSVRLFEVTPAIPGPGKPIGGVVARLTFGVDYIAVVSSVDSTGSTLVILPLKPLKPKTSYAVLITDELKGTNGKAVGASISYLLTRGASPLAVSPPSNPTSDDDILVGSLKAGAGASQAEIDEAYTSAATLEGLRSQLVQPSETVLLADASNSDITSSNVILHWGFTTQSTTDVLTQLRSDIRAEAAPLTSFLPIGPGLNPVAESPGPNKLANIYVGQLPVKYFLDPASGVNDPAPLASFWKGIGGSLLTYLAPNPGCAPANTNVCVVTANPPQPIPLMLSIPKVGSAPWPVVIYQHGITTNRATMLAVADSLAAAGMAVVAIDMPMHGLTGNETNGTEAFYSVGAAGPGKITERTFDLDLVTQDADGNITAAAPDGVTDTSGTHFINLSNLQNTRDNVRQAVSDLFSLAYALTTMDYDGGGADFDPNRIYFLGHSLGAMVGTTFLAHEESVRDAVLASGGASLAKILDGSAAFGPTIAAGLAAKGVIKGTADYEAFLGAAQTVTDSGDPVNHATTAAAGRGILFFEIVGGNSSPSDLVVPNTVPDANDTTGTIPAPLAGTEPQLALMGLTQHNTTQMDADLHVVTKYIVGNHGSLLDPSDTDIPPSAPGDNLKVTTEIQTQAANFFGSDGAVLLVTDGSVLQAPPAPAQ